MLQQVSPYSWPAFEVLCRYKTRSRSIYVLVKTLQKTQPPIIFGKTCTVPPLSGPDKGPVGWGVELVISQGQSRGETQIMFFGESPPKNTASNLIWQNLYGPVSGRAVLLGR